MDIYEAMAQRHSVRQYLDKPLEAETLEKLRELIAEANAESGLHIQLVENEPRAFDSTLAHYGKFSGVTNYLAMVGKKGADETVGYYGEKLVLEMQMLGLNSCWVALTFKKIPDAFALDAGEKLYIVIALGYGANSGAARKSKSYADVAKSDGEAPEWFKKGVEAALLAPTATNQQKFRLELSGEKVAAKAGMGFSTKLDLGIVKYHFELGSDRDASVWL